MAAADTATPEPVRKFICGIATGTEPGYPDEAYESVLRRIKDFVDAPDLEVRRFNRGALEVYAGLTITNAQQRLIQAVVMGFNTGFRIGTQKHVPMTTSKE